MSKKLRTRKRRNVSLESLPEDIGSYEMEDALIAKIDAEKLQQNLKIDGDEDVSSFLVLADEYGLNVEDIQELCGLKKDVLHGLANDA